MIVRKIHREELKRCAQLSALAFEFSMHGAKQTPEAFAREKVENPRSWEDVHWNSRWAAFEDDDATMMATFCVLPWRANFDGHEVVMGGIGGVASLPQYRRGGAIRRCFEAALPDMYAQGMTLSYLYAFSNAFYRKFGYELACDGVRWRLRLAGLPTVEVGGSWRLLEPDRPMAEALRAVDGLRERRYNCMVIAGDTEYLWTREDPFVTRDYTYVYFDGAGKPSAYATVQPQPGRELTCKRFVFNDREGFLGLVALLRRFEADHSHAVMTLPEDIDLRGLLPEFSFGNVERTTVQLGLARVIDVEKTLRLARMRGEGCLRVGVSDGQIPQNNGVFEVRFAPGRENVVRRVDGAADISLSIQDFSRLILGCCESADPMWLPGVTLNCPPEWAAQVFYRKPNFITQFF